MVREELEKNKSNKNLNKDIPTDIKKVLIISMLFSSE